MPDCIFLLTIASTPGFNIPAADNCVGFNPNGPIAAVSEPPAPATIPAPVATAPAVNPVAAFTAI